VPTATGNTSQTHFPSSSARLADQALGLGIDVGVTPLPVEDHQAIGDALIGASDPVHGLTPDAGHIQVGADARQQLAGAERLDQVVVGAGLQPLHARLLAGAGRQEDHRDRAGPGVGPQRAQQAEPVEARHHHVGQHQFRRAGTGGRQRRLAVGDGLHVVTPPEEATDIVAHVRVVVGPEDTRPSGDAASLSRGVV
jgi:hypothetical protein